MRKIPLIFFFLLTTASFAQINIYVNSTASNGGSGSLGQPFNKIQTAIANVVPNSFTIINIAGGTYNENIWIDKSGLPNGYLTLRPYLNGTVILDGTNQVSKDAIIIQGANYVRIEGLVIQNFIADFAKGIGIYCTNANSSFIEIIGNEIKNINTVINTNSCFPLVCYGFSSVNQANFISNITIAQNKVHDCNTGFSEGIQVNYDTRNFEISGNEVYNITNIGIVAGGFHGGINKQATNGKITQNKVYNCKSPFAIAAGIYIDGAKNITAERNIVTDCQKGMAINCEINGKTAENDTIRNNLVCLNTRGGFNFGGNAPTTTSGSVSNSAILNNSTFQNFNPLILAPGESIPINFGELTLYFSENSKVINNIFHAGNHNQMLNCQGILPNNFTLNNNVWFADVALYAESFRYFTCFQNNLGGYQLCSGKEQASVFGNPYYQNPSQGNLKIRCASAAISVGSNSIFAGPKDYFGENRINNTLDAGADEFEKYWHESTFSGNWDSQNSWALKLVPIPCDEVLIKAGNIISVNNSQPVNCKLIKIENSGVLNLQSGSLINLKGSN
jgi:hypothetical protein